MFLVVLDALLDLSYKLEPLLQPRLYLRVNLLKLHGVVGVPNQCRIKLRLCQTVFGQSGGVVCLHVVLVTIEQTGLVEHTVRVVQVVKNQLHLFGRRHFLRPATR